MTNDNIAARKIMEAADFIAATGATPDVRAWDHLVAYLPKDQTKYEYVQDVLRRLNDGGISLNCCAKLILAGIAQTPDISKRPFAFAVRRAPENGPDQWRLFMDEGEARAEAEQLDGDYEALFRVGDRRSAIAALQAPVHSDALERIIGLCKFHHTYRPQDFSHKIEGIAEAALTAPAAKAPAVSEADVGRIPHAEVDKTVTDLIRANYSDKPRLALAIGRAIVKANERGIQSADDARSGTVLLLKQVMQTRAVDYVEAQFPGWHNRASATLSRETKLVPSDPPSQEASAPPIAGGR